MNKYLTRLISEAVDYLTKEIDEPVTTLSFVIDWTFCLVMVATIIILLGQ